MTTAAIRAAREFDRIVDQWIVGMVDQVTCFDELVAALPGVYPPIAAAALERVAGAGTISTTHFDVCSRRAEAVTARSRSTQTALPPPHPLDFDWRYGTRAVDLLLDVVEHRSAPGDTVALIGTPTLLVAAHERNLDRRLVLIDANPTTVDRLREVGLGREVIRRDVFVGEVPSLGASVVVADPPWYPEHVEAFLWAAATCSAPRASVVMSLPPSGTRPGIRAERADFRASAREHGLWVVHVSEGALPYVSPPFEINALRAAGWVDLPDEWRRGDLIELQRRGAAGLRPPRPLRGARWDERSLGSMRVRIRRRRTSSTDPTLVRLVDGDVLSDVSRRHPIRAEVDVWTSGNRIYRCGAPSVLLAVLDSLASGSDPIRAAAATIGRELIGPEVKNIARAVSQLNQLGRAEGRELSRLGWPNDPRTSMDARAYVV